MASEGDVDGVAAALAAGVAVDLRDDADGCTALHWAADRGHLEVHSTFNVLLVLRVVLRSTGADRKALSSVFLKHALPFHHNRRSLRKWLAKRADPTTYQEMYGALLC